MFQGTPSTQAAAQVIDDVYELRLTALFRQLVRSRGHKGAARVLGLDPRTVAGSVQQGMSRRVRDAVEKMLVERDGGARDELEEAVEGLAGQVGGLTTQVAGLEGELREGMKALGETHAQGMRRLEQRLAQGDAGKGGGCVASPALPLHARRRGGGGYRPGGVYPDLGDRRTPPMTTRRSLMKPGPWSTSGAGCGTGIRPGARAWRGCQPASGFWNWKLPCWRSTA